MRGGRERRLQAKHLDSDGRVAVMVHKIVHLHLVKVAVVDGTAVPPQRDAPLLQRERLVALDLVHLRHLEPLLKDVAALLRLPVEFGLDLPNLGRRRLLVGPLDDVVVLRWLLGFLLISPSLLFLWRRLLCCPLCHFLLHRLSLYFDLFP